jgi:hypothetical protein
LDFGCAWSADPGGILDFHVLDGVQPTGVVGMAFRCGVGSGGMVRASHFVRGITFQTHKD